LFKYKNNGWPADGVIQRQTQDGESSPWPAVASGERVYPQTSKLLPQLKDLISGAILRRLLAKLRKLGSLDRRIPFGHQLRDLIGIG